MRNLTTHYLQLPDIKIAYTEYGSGPTLILLHGNSSSKRFFRRYQTEHFADFHTYALDSRGHGESVSADTAYSIDQYSDDVIHFCEQSGISAAYVIGYSDGGNIALFLAKKRPDLFTKIVAISPNYRAAATKPFWLGGFRTMQNLFRLLKRLGINTHKAIMRFELMLTDIGLTDDDLRGINANLQVIYADNDMFYQEHYDAVAQLVPGVIMRRIDHSNHLTICGKAETIGVIRATLNNERENGDAQ